MSEKERGSQLVTLVGAVGAVMVVTGIVVAAVQALRPEPSSAAAGDVPAIEVIAPQPHDTVDAPIAVHFRAGDRLALGRMGWASDDLHLHAYVDGAEIMPAAADIEARSDGTFVWRIPAAAGERTLELSWAGMQHGSLREGASGEVRIVVR